MNNKLDICEKLQNKLITRLRAGGEHPIEIIILLVLFLLVILSGCNQKVNNKITLNCVEFQDPADCEISKALLENDIDRCSDFDPDKSNECRMLFGVRNNDYSICNGLDMIDKEICYIGVITNKQDYKTCYQYPYAANLLHYSEEGYSDEEINKYCNTLIIGENKDKKEICNNKPADAILIGNESWVTYCKEVINVLDRKKSDCELITYEIEKELCLLDYASFYLDSDVCSQIQDESNMEFCFKDVAVFSGDMTLCPKTNFHPGCISKIIGRNSLT